MKFDKIVLLDFNESDLDKKELDKLAELTKALELIKENDKNRLGKIKDADAIIVKIFTKIDKHVIDNCANLKYIGVFSTAFGEIDTKYAAEKGIVVTNMGSYSTEAVSEFVFDALLEHIRELEKAKNQARNKDYSFDKFLNYELKGKRFGIIGLGSIGKRVSEIAIGFSLDVVYWSRTRKRDYENKGVKFVELDAILKTSDIITIHLAFNKETKHFLNKERLEKIKNNAAVVCLSPVDLVNIDALVNLLGKKQFTFITDHLDVLDEGKRKKLENASNCVIYPPVAFRTKEANDMKNYLLIDNLVKFSKGVIQNKVN